MFFTDYITGLKRKGSMRVRKAPWRRRDWAPGLNKWRTTQEKTNCKDRKHSLSKGQEEVKSAS